MATPLGMRRSIAALAVASLFTLPVVAAEKDEATIVVTATRQATRHNELLSETTVIDRADMDRATPIDSLGDVLARQSGMEVVITGAPGATTNVFIRGASGTHTLLLIDGMRAGSATLGEAGFSRIPMNLVERVEVLRGPASGLYGADAIGGVVQVFTRPSVEGTQLTAGLRAGSFNTVEADAGIAFRAGGTSASLRAGEHRSDGFSSIRKTTNPSFNADQDGYDNTHVSASFGHQFTPGHELSLSLLHSDGESQFDGRYYDQNFAAHADYDFRTRHKIGNAVISSRNKFSPAWTSTLQYGASNDDSRNFSAPGKEDRFKTTQRQISWQNDLKLPVGKALLAVEKLDQEIDTSATYTQRERSIDSLLAGWGGSFGGARIQTNVRRDRNTQFGDKTTGNLALGWQLSDASRLRAAAGTAFKAPSFNDLYYPIDDFGNGGNPNLKPESARSVELGYNRETARGQVALTLWRSDVEDLISWQPVNAADPYSAWRPTNIGETRLQGLSLSARHHHGTFSGHAALDYTDAKDLATDKLLPQRARERATIGVDAYYGETTLGAEVQAVGERFDDAANTKRLHGYALINLRLEQRLSKTLSLDFNVANLMDRDYEIRRDYGSAGRAAYLGLRYRG